MIDRLRLVGSAEAAKRLGLNESRIRALASRGAIPARKVANRWLLDADALERRAAGEWPRGRAFEPANAWAVLFLISEEDVPWISEALKKRLLRRIRLRSLRDHLPRLRHRAKVHYFQGADLLRGRLGKEPDLVRSGVSASEVYGLNIKAQNVMDGYLPAGKVPELAYRYALRPVDERSADLILRAVNGPWPFDGRSVAPPAAVAADLVDSIDQRSRRAGEQFVARLAR